MSRAAIAADVAARLLAAGVADGRVSRARVTDLPADAVLPAVIVYCLDGDAEPRAVNRPKFRETWNVKIECWCGASADEDLDDNLDTVRAACLAALYEDEDFFALYRIRSNVKTSTAYAVSGSGRRGIQTIDLPLQVEAIYTTTAQSEGPYLQTVAATTEGPVATGTVTGLGVEDD